MSPYTRDVVDAALADYDYGAGKTRAQQSLDLAGGGAWGGSGAALTRSMTEGELLRGRASTSANLRDQAWNRGTALASDDAMRRQQASQSNAQFLAERQRLNLDAARQLADLDNMRWTNARNDVSALSGIGDTVRSIETAQRQAPIDVIGQLTKAYSGLPLELFAGKTETGASRSTTVGVEAGFNQKG